MSHKRAETSPIDRRSAPGVSMRAIRGLASLIAEKFRPDKIILFGSHAHGTPHADSDVDLLVVMPARNMIDQAVRIRMALPRLGFPLDLIVRTPEYLRRRLAMEDWFHREIVGKGKVLYEAGDSRVGPKGREGLATVSKGDQRVEPP